MLFVDIAMTSPKAAEASPSPPQSTRRDISNSPRATTAGSISPTALVDAVTQEQGQDAAIEADNDSSGDADSALGLSDVRSFTTSLASSVYNYTYENGRRYHAYQEGEYLFPNDDTEQDRLDMLHHIFRLVLRGSLYKAPISNPLQRVLDFGTGTGIWAIDFADEHPSAEVIGNDLSPIQPSWIPPNLKFEVDNVESPWIDNQLSSFDLIHGRSMSGSISNWPTLFTSCIEALKPGGWLEMQEFDVWFQSEEGELPADSAIMEWQKYIDEASRMFGKKLNVAAEMAAWMREVGFDDVREEVIKVPIGSWPKSARLKEQGRWLQAQMLESIEPISLAYCTRILMWSEERTRVFIITVRNEFLNNKTHLFAYCRFIYGRRP